MAAEVKYTRSGGRGQPPEAETLTIAGDGTFEAWRSVGARAAGRFAGSLDGDGASRIATLVDAVAGSAAPSATLMPGAARETIAIDGTSVDVSKDSGGQWKDLRDELRAALDQAVDSPADAVTLVVAADPLSARLETTGSVEMDASEGTARAVLWTEGYEEKGREDVSLSAGDGIALPATLQPGPGDRLQVTATFTIVRNGAKVGVQVVAEATG